jgi:nicotinamidase/pyrazinamidase
MPYEKIDSDDSSHDGSPLPQKPKKSSGNNLTLNQFNKSQTLVPVEEVKATDVRYSAIAPKNDSRPENYNRSQMTVPAFSKDPETKLSTFTTKKPICKKTALVILDMTHDYCEAGAMKISGIWNLLPHMNSLIREFDWTSIIKVRDLHPKDHKSFISNFNGAKSELKSKYLAFGITKIWESKNEGEFWADHCAEGTVGADFDKLLKIDSEIEHIINKGTKGSVVNDSAFSVKGQEDTGMETLCEKLELERLVFCGAAFDNGVGKSAMDGLRLGYECVIVEDATRFILKEGKAEMRERLVKAGGKILDFDGVAEILVS